MSFIGDKNVHFQIIFAWNPLKIEFLIRFDSEIGPTFSNDAHLIIRI